MTRGRPLRDSKDAQLTPTGSTNPAIYIRSVDLHTRGLEDVEWRHARTRWWWAGIRVTAATALATVSGKASIACFIAGGIVATRWVWRRAAAVAAASM